MAKNKLWLINGSVYRTETNFKKTMNSLARSKYRSNATYQILEVTEQGTLDQWKQNLESEKTKNERDLQLKSILNELDVKETAILDVIRMYSSYQENVVVTDDKDRKQLMALDLKNRVLKRMNEAKFDKVEFSKVIIDYKRHLIYLSKDLDWHISLLKCHRFQHYFTESKKWNRSISKYEYTEVIPEEMLNVLKEARASISKENRKNKK
jgi:hypothetical protein